MSQGLAWRRVPDGYVAARLRSRVVVAVSRALSCAGTPLRLPSALEMLALENLVHACQARSRALRIRSLHSSHPAERAARRLSASANGAPRVLSRRSESRWLPGPVSSRVTLFATEGDFLVQNVTCLCAAAPVRHFSCCPAAVCARARARSRQQHRTSTCLPCSHRNATGRARFCQQVRLGGYAASLDADESALRASEPGTAKHNALLLRVYEQVALLASGVGSRGRDSMATPCEPAVPSVAQSTRAQTGLRAFMSWSRWARSRMFRRLIRMRWAPAS
eukprot:720966-Pleurochrysis_carterae.AAC.3